MIHLFYTQLSDVSEEKWQHYFQQMPLDIQERIHRYKRLENKHQLLLGRLLLKHGMKELGFKNFKLESIYYNKKNCPLCLENINFSIAHSGNLVACAFSKSVRIGIDVEQVKPINLANFDYVLNDRDRKWLSEDTANTYRSFFKIWTIKEAVTKALGEGLGIDVRPITIFKNDLLCADKKWYFQNLDIQEGYVAHLVSERAITQLSVHEVNF